MFIVAIDGRKIHRNIIILNLGYIFCLLTPVSHKFIDIPKHNRYYFILQQFSLFFFNNFHLQKLFHVFLGWGGAGISYPSFEFF